MSKTPEKPEGLRERKRRETRRRLTETGLRLFLERGYEATTLDAIAEAADVSRRTIFHYFNQKDDILLAWQSGIGEAIRAAILRERPEKSAYRWSGIIIHSSMSFPFSQCLHASGKGKPP